MLAGLGWDVIVAGLILLGFFFSLSSYIILIIIANYIGSRLRSPPKNWKSYLQQAKAAGADLPKFGNKSAAIRRQLILHSPNVSYYTNMLPLSVSKLPKSALDFKKKSDNRRTIFGFFHPYANAGGGGERVLWAAVRQTLINNPDNVCAIYVGREPETTPQLILSNVQRRFGISLDEDRVVFIFLPERYLVDAKFWPRFTLIGQSLGSIILAYKAISTLVPDVWVDTMGYPFCYPVIDWILNIPICAYVHYPFVSKDMLRGVKMFSFKSLYWRIMMLLYTFVGSYATIVAVNSTWTQQHIQSIWRFGHKKDRIKVVYPPCATQDFDRPTSEPRNPVAVCLAQFRPEKRHGLLLDQFAQVVKKFQENPELHPKKPHLILIGSVRTDEDKSRVYTLRLQARELELGDDYLTFVLDAPWENVKAILSSSSVGVNPMWNEHFGMGVVEYMAAGLIPVAHNSAGPKLDIIVSSRIDSEDEKKTHHRPGFLFSSNQDPDYDAKNPGNCPDLSAVLYDALTLNADDAAKLRLEAYEAAQRFSDDAFAAAWDHRVEILGKLEVIRKRARLLRGKYD